MNHKNWLAALAACMLLPAAAQSPSHRPTAEEARESRENSARIARLADSMERARIAEDAKPVAAYIPKEPAVKDAPALRHPEVFIAKAPAVKPAKKAKKKKS